MRNTRSAAAYSIPVVCDTIAECLLSAKAAVRPEDGGQSSRCRKLSGREPVVPVVPTIGKDAHDGFDFLGDRPAVLAL
jgi:hypothetical protein